MLRVIAGQAKGRRLESRPGDATRPTADRVKEALFNILGDRVAGAVVLDLCAGSGSLGIEALSRGARFCTFVEKDRKCLEVIRRNLEKTAVSAFARIVPMALPGALSTLAKEAGPAVTLILADPPYHDRTLAGDILRAVGASNILAPGGLLCLERPLDHGPKDVVTGLRLREQRKYGTTVLLIYEAGE